MDRENKPSSHKNQNMIPTIITLVGVVALVSLCVLWWNSQGLVEDNATLVATADSPYPQIEAPLAVAGKDSLDSAMQTYNAASIEDERSNSIQSTNEQQAVFDSLWGKLHDPQLRDSLTVEQIINTPGFKSLPDSLMQQLLDEAMAMLQRGELDPARFMEGKFAGLPQTRRLPASYAAQQPGTDQVVLHPVTEEQRQSLDDIKQKLGDPEYTETLTATKMLAMEEVQDMPASLRQELMGELTGMLSRGELDQELFFAAPSSSGSSLQNGGDEAATGSDLEAQRAATTHEQWLAYETVRGQLHNPDFLASTNLSQLLSSPQVQILPEYLREELAATIVERMNENTLDR